MVKILVCVICDHLSDRRFLIQILFRDLRHQCFFHINKLIAMSVDVLIKSHGVRRVVGIFLTPVSVRKRLSFSLSIISAFSVIVKGTTSLSCICSLP